MASEEATCWKSLVLWQAKSLCAGAPLAMLGTSPRSAVHVLIADQMLASLGYRNLGQVLVA